jgi:hypothetical protein
MYFAKKGGRRSDDQRDVYMLRGANLAFMTSFKKPGYVSVNAWPPEAIRQGAMCREKSFVS